MTAERHIDYEALALGAMRGVVRTVLARVAKSGLPGEHHFYIAFATEAPGVTISKRLKEKYPREMTVVLQHRFWDLAVTEHQFEVKLTFDGVPERLVVPFSAIKVFFDPSAPYALQFEQSDLAESPTQFGPARLANAETPPAPNATEPSEAPSAKAEKKRAPRKQRLEKEADKPAATAGNKALPRPRVVASRESGPGEPANQPKIIELDKFRKK